MIEPYRKLACGVVSQAVDLLKAHHRPRDIAWFTDHRRSEVFCVAAGLDYDEAISQLRHDGHLTPAAPTPPGPKPPKQTMPTRTKAYQMALRRKMLKRLPNSPGTGCSTREMAHAVSVCFKAAQNVLVSLKRDQMAATRTEARRGGMAAIWWRV